MSPPGNAAIHWVRNEPAGGRKATLAINAAAFRVGSASNPAVVIATHIRMMPAARALRSAVGSRSLLIVHAKEMREQPQLARAAVTWADLIVAASTFSRDLALEAGADPRRIRVINPGVTLPDDEPPLLTARPGPPTILTISRMDDLHKGHRQALEALVQLRDRIPDVQWIMIGEGRLRPQLMRVASELGLDASVVFTGAVGDEDLSDRLDSAHVFCLPSQPAAPGGAGEGFGMVLIEAAAHGLPLVAGRVPGVVDAVRENVDGLLVDPPDAQGFRIALERLLRDRTLAAGMGQAGRARAADLSWPRVAERYETAIDEMLSRPAPRTTLRSVGWIRDLLRGPRL